MKSEKPKTPSFKDRHGIVQSAMKKDLLYFALPAIAVFIAGLVVSAGDGYDGLVETIWDLLTQSRSLESLSTANKLGLTLFIFGLTFALVAVGTLRRYYLSTLVIIKDHQLITHGIYSLVRHPIYSGAIVICFSVPVYAASLYGAFTMSLLIPIFLVRIKLEEDLLTEAFGDTYRQYAQNTKRLIPFVY